MPAARTVRYWIVDEKHEAFAQSYARAKRARADLWAEQITQLADEAREGVRIKETDKGTETVTGDMVERSKLQVDARKWLLARLDPDRYGDRQTIDLNAKGQKRIGDMSDEELRAELSALHEEQKTRLLPHPSAAGLEVVELPAPE